MRHIRMMIDGSSILLGGLLVFGVFGVFGE